MSAAQPLSPWRWLVIPSLLCVAGVILFAAPLRIAGLRLPEPVFPVVVAFAWAMIRPSVMAPFFLLLLGVFLDVFWGGPMGLWPVSLLVAYGTVLSARTMLVGQSQAALGFWYAGAVGLAMGAAYLLTTLDAHAAPSLVAVGEQALATVVLYPFAYGLIDRFEDADVRFR